MKKLLIIFSLLLMVGNRAVADEGMWLLPMLEKLNIKDMKAKGFKLSAKDIYDINKNSLKDAIVIFGNGCTGEIVSKDGLIFTNHHCGFGAIQQLSSVEHDYLKNGYWAMNRNEELPAEGLSVRFIRTISDVSDQILAGVTDAMTEEQRNKKIGENMTQLEKTTKTTQPEKSVLIEKFFGGNQYFMFLIDEYKDIRLVGTPPFSIGKFGGDTDNWMWPRHTGDFSVFRVYSDANGRPVEYSKDNIPYKAPKHLAISLKGYKSGDFAMIMGFPGTTNRYMTSFDIDRVLSVDNPSRIFIRGVRQDILKKDMASSDAIRIQYSSKYASSSNYWKNSIGMSRGLIKLNVKAKKEEIEARFTQWIAADESREKYKKALPLIENALKESVYYAKNMQYISEAILRAVEITNMPAILKSITGGDTLPANKMEDIRVAAEGFYKDYNENTDKKVAKAMFKIINDSLANDVKPSIFNTIIKDKFNGNTDLYVDYLYNESIFANKAKFDAFMTSPSVEILRADPVAEARKSIIAAYNKQRGEYISYAAKLNEGRRLFIDGLMKMEPNKKHYPDANFTIRLTYGSILPYKPADGIMYDYYTTLSGVIAKEDKTNPVEFTVPDKLKELYKAKDFGDYAFKGDIPVGFLSNNDITGGNSGSPIMNAKGELLGLAFDGNWEAMSGDIAFESELQRTINVDIRYVLFIIDKFGGAGWLLDEMTIVK